MPESGPTTLFLSYAREDESFCQVLKKHLTLLRQQELVSDWHDRQITPGDDWKKAIDKQLEQAQIIVLLVSVDFLASNYCYGIEMKRALERHQAGEARVIPILIRSCDWDHAPFAQIQLLPTDARPISSWQSQDEAWTNVVKGIRFALSGKTGSVSPEPKAPSLPRESSPSTPDQRNRVHSPVKETVVMKASAKNPKNQFKNVTAFADALKTVIARKTIGDELNLEDETKTQNGKKNAKKNNAFRFRTWMIVAGIVILALLFASIYLALPGNLTNTCVSTFLDVCGDGLGTYSVSIGKDALKLGIIDENSGDSFNIDTRENYLETLIFQANKEADKGEHFTLLVATTLSKTAQDPAQSAFVGKEELAGVYIAQEEYNKQHPSKKLRLVIANLGVKDFANDTVPQMMRQIALFAKKVPAQDHFMGIVGFPFSTVLQPAMQLIHNYGLPVVSSSASSDDFNDKLPEFHRVIGANSQQNPALLRFIGT